MAKSEFSGQLSDSDLRMLRIFKAVVESGGFSAAEVELNISRAAISMAMSDLELRLGFKLCQRGRSGFSLTEQGAEIYAYTLQLLSAVQTFKTQVNTLHDQLRGELNIGITDNLVTMPKMRVTQSLAKLKQLGPEVKINISMIPPYEIEKGVLDGRLHVGVIPDLRPLSGLNYIDLYDEASAIYCSNEHELFQQNMPSADELKNWDAVVPSYAQTAETKALHQYLKATATATDREGVAFLILTGRFIGYLPCHYASQWVNQRLMKNITPEQLSYQTRISAIYRKSAPSNLVLDTFINAINETAP